MGPDLTNVASAPDKGLDYLKAFIAKRHGQDAGFRF